MVLSLVTVCYLYYYIHLHTFLTCPIFCVCASSNKGGNYNKSVFGYWDTHRIFFWPFPSTKATLFNNCFLTVHLVFLLFYFFVSQFSYFASSNLSLSFASPCPVQTTREWFNRSPTTFLTRYVLRVSFAHAFICGSRSYLLAIVMGNGHRTRWLWAWYNALLQSSHRLLVLMSFENIVSAQYCWLRVHCKSCRIFM